MEISIRDVQQLGQSIWYDNIRRGLISSGELKNILDLGVTGLTSNPTIFQKAVSESNDYDELFKELVKTIIKGFNIEYILNFFLDGTFLYKKYKMIQFSF